jgi:hypothetical protein
MGAMINISCHLSLERRYKRSRPEVASTYCKDEFRQDSLTDLTLQPMGYGDKKVFPVRRTEPLTYLDYDGNE